MTDTEILAGRYRRIHDQLARLIAKSPEPVSRMATAAALLHHKLPQFFWTGFYLVRGENLVVGPYQGPLACLILGGKRGVCWAALERRETVLVPDVRNFPGHVACDERSVSEIAVPVPDDTGTIRAVLDVDSTQPDAFSSVDAEWLERIAALIGKNAAWDKE